MKKGRGALGSGKPGRKRKNMPGYRLGMAKDGDKAWMVANRPQDIKKVISREEFFKSNIAPGTIIGLDSNNNGIFLGFHKEQAIVFNPKNNQISPTSLNKQKNIRVMRAFVSNDYFESGNKWIDTRKIPGTDLFVSDILSNPHEKTKDLDTGKEYGINDYFKNSRPGDLINLSFADGDFRVLMSTRKFLVLEDNENSIDALNLGKNSESNKWLSKTTVNLLSRDPAYTNINKVKNTLKDNKYRLVNSTEGAVGTIKDKAKSDNKANKVSQYLDDKDDIKLEEEFAEIQNQTLPRVFSNSAYRDLYEQDKYHSSTEQADYEIKRIKEELLSPTLFRPSVDMDNSSSVLTARARMLGRYKALKKIIQDRDKVISDSEIESLIKENSKEPYFEAARQEVDNLRGYKEKTKEELNSLALEQKNIVTTNRVGRKSQLEALGRYQGLKDIIDKKNNELSIENDLDKYKNDDEFNQIYENTKEGFKFDSPETRFLRKNQLFPSYLKTLESNKDESGQILSDESRKFYLALYKAHKELFDKKNKNNGAQTTESKNLNASNRFNGYDRFSGSLQDIQSQIRIGDFVFGYNKITGEIEELEAGESLVFASRVPVIRNKKGKQIQIGNGSYVLLSKSKYSIDTPEKNLIPNDIIVIENNDGTYKNAIVSFKPKKPDDANPHPDELILLDYEDPQRVLGALNDFDFEVPRNSTKAHTPENVLMTLPKEQTHIIIHGDDVDRFGRKTPKNSAYEIKSNELKFNPATNKLERFVKVVDKDGNEKNINVINDEISSDLVNSNSKISSIEYPPGGDYLIGDEYFEEKVRIREELEEDGNKVASKRMDITPLSKLNKMGLQNFLVKLAIPGVHNNQTINGTNVEYGEISYVNDLSINGIYAGTIKRSLELDTNTDYDYICKNELFTLPSSLQGMGIAQQFYDAQEAVLRNDFGIHQIKMHCALDVGGYAWAKKGFDFEDAEQGNMIQERILERVHNLKREDWKSIDPDLTNQEIEEHKENIEYALSGLYNAEEFAEFQYKYEDKKGNIREVKAKREPYIDDIDSNQYSLGKAGMLGSDWYGVKNI